MLDVFSGRVLLNILDSREVNQNGGAAWIPPNLGWAGGAVRLPRRLRLLSMMLVDESN
jgi:hypothetical protein